MKNKNLVIIECYCDTEEKLSLLDKMITTLNDKFDILVTTHYFLPERIQAKIDYLIYDKSNPILKYPERGMEFWRKISNIKITHIMDDYGWTVYNLKKNAISFCADLNYDYYSFINYDIEITEDLVHLLNNPKDFICTNFLDPISKKSLFPSLLFNILSKNNANKIYSLIDKEDYVKSDPNTNKSLYSDAEAYWGYLISNFKYKKITTEIVGIANTGNPDVLNYNKVNDDFKLFFDYKNKLLLVYDNHNEKDIKLNINDNYHVVSNKFELIKLYKVNKLGFYDNENYINLIPSYNKKHLNRIEILKEN